MQSVTTRIWVFIGVYRVLYGLIISGELILHFFLNEFKRFHMLITWEIHHE